MNLANITVQQGVSITLAIMAVIALLVLMIKFLRTINHEEQTQELLNEIHQFWEERDREYDNSQDSVPTISKADIREAMGIDHE